LNVTLVSAGLGGGTAGATFCPLAVTDSATYQVIVGGDWVCGG